LLGKENAVLLPFLLLITEWALLRGRGLNADHRRNLVQFFLLVTALPAISAALYLLTHPGYLTFDGRPFTQWERLLTESRVLWFYVRLQLLPDPSAMGLFHDDFALSKGLLSPWTTLASIFGWAVVIAGVVLLRRRLPLLAFAVLFFLVGHLLESTVFPLELVYEHRNYLPGFGLLFAVAAVPTAYASMIPIRQSLLYLFIAAIITAFASMTAMRSIDWSSEAQFVFREVENHPGSSRANFRMAQLLMTVTNPALEAEAVAIARLHFERVHEANPEDVDGLFGIIILDLHLGNAPSSQLVSTLAEKLRVIPFSPLNVTVDHFPFLVRIAQNPKAKARLSSEQLLELFESALGNPTLPTAGRVILYNSLRHYHLVVLRDLERALQYAKLAVRADPTLWTARDRLVRLLAALRHWDAAEAELRSARDMDRLGLYQREANELSGVIAAARRGEPVLVAPQGKDI
jgi:hypothetical protein